MTVDLRVLLGAGVDSAELQEVVPRLRYELKSCVGPDLDDDEVASDGGPPPEAVEGGDPGQRRGQVHERVRARHQVVLQLRE